MCIARTQLSRGGLCHAADAGNGRRCESSSVSTSMRLPLLANMIPVQQHRTERGHQPVGDVPRAGQVVVMRLRQHAAQRGDTGAHHIHRMRGGRDGFQHRLHRGRQAAQRSQLRLVGAPAPPCSAACRAPADARSPRTRRPRRRRECHSRDNADRCRCARRCTSAVLPAATPDRATDFFGFGSSLIAVSRCKSGSSL